MLSVLTIARRTILALWLALLGLILGLVLLTHVAGALGYRLVIIRGGSMTPAIPLGALAIEQPVTASGVAPGDVVTVALPSGPLVTHRVVRLATLDGQLAVETKGDANENLDPALQPATRVTGIVRFHVPIAGFLLAFLGIPTGVLCVISMLGSLLSAVWILEELEIAGAASVASTTFLGHELAA